MLTLFRMGIFGAAHGCGVGGGEVERFSLPKICHRYLTMMKIGAVIPYLKKIQQIYKPRDIFTGANFVISRNTDIDCILIHNF